MTSRPIMTVQTSDARTAVEYVCDDLDELPDHDLDELHRLGLLLLGSVENERARRDA